VAVAVAALLFVAACKELPKIQPPSLVVSNPTVALAAFLDGHPAAPR
jgi:hypothetical protein